MGILSDFLNRFRSDLRVLAVLPDPVGSDEAKLLSADARWTRLSETLKERPTGSLVLRQRPPTPGETLQTIRFFNPGVIFLDAVVGEQGWLLENELGEAEWLTPSHFLKLKPAARVLVTREGLPPNAGIDAMEGGLAIVELKEEASIEALAPLLEAVAEGQTVAEAAECVRKAGLEIGVRGKPALIVAREGRRDRPGAKNTTLLDRLPKGTPPSLPQPILVTSTLNEIARALCSDKHRGVLVAGEHGAGKTTVSVVAIRRMAHKFRDGILGAEPSLPITGLGDLKDSAANRFHAPTRDEAVAHELRRRRTLIFIEDCDRIEPRAMEELVSFLRRIPPWTKTKLLFTAVSPPDSLKQLSLVTVKLGRGLEKQEGLQLLRHLMGQKRPTETSTRGKWLNTLAAFEESPRAVGFVVAQAERGIEVPKPAEPGFFEKLMSTFNAAFRPQLVIERLMERLVDRLSPLTRKLFARFSLFAAPPTYQALQHVCRDIQNLQEPIDDLLSKGLLTVEDRTLKLHPILAQIAARRFPGEDESEDPKELEKRFVEAFVGFADFYGSNISAVENQLPNLQRALDLAEDRDDIDVDKVVLLARFLCDVLRDLGRYHESEKALRIVLARTGDAALLPDRLTLGDLYMQRGEWQEAAELFRDTAEAADEPAERMVVLQRLSRSLTALGRLEEAKETLTESLEITEGDSPDRANALLYLGILGLRSGDMRQAEKSLQQSLELHQNTGNLVGVALAHQNLGIVARSEGRIEEAEVNFQTALEGWNMLGNAHAEALALRELGNLFRDNDPRRASKMLGDAERLDRLRSGLDLEISS